MILARISRHCLIAPLASSLVVMATEARADVLELGAEGARWVAGGPVNAGAPADLALANDQGVAVPAQTIVDPRIQIPGVPAVYAAKVAEVSRRYNLSPRLIEALVWQESRWRHDAVSSAGARGLTQLMPGTARYLGVNPDDPMQNLEGGARYLREQLDRFDGNLVHALAAYNAGPGRVIKAGGIPNIRETRNYVAAIMARLASNTT